MANAIAIAPGVQPVAAGALQVTWFLFKSPSWPGREFLNRFLFPVLMNLSKTSAAGVTSAAFVSPDDLAGAAARGELWFQIPPEYKAGRVRPWAVVIQWKAQAPAGSASTEFVPLPLVIAAIAGVLTAIVGLCVFTPFTKAVADLGDTARKTILNPGFVIAALVGLAVVMRGKR